MKYPAWFQPHHKTVNERLDRQDETLCLILSATERLLRMSGTVSQKLDDAAARDEAALAKLSADLTAIADELKANAPDAGSVVTQAQVDRHLAIATGLEAAAAAADAMVVPAPAPVEEPPAAP
jgi:hypothetical protein